MLAPEGRLVLPVTHLAAVRVSHWLHLLRANHLAQLGWGSRLLRTSPLRLLWAVLRARSLNRYRVMDKLTQRGRGCDVHPSAVVEASVLGRDVRVGAHSLVRFSHLGDGVHVAEHAHVSESVLGAGSAVSRMGVLKGCVLYPGANTGHYGIQLSVVGRDAFLGGEVLLGDFMPSGDVRVRHRGEVVSAGTRLLGCAVGHRCRLFMRATVYPGREIPNDLTILGPTRDAISRVPEDLPTDVALTSEDGVLRPLGGEGEVP